MPMQQIGWGGVCTGGAYDRPGAQLVRAGHHALIYSSIGARTKTLGCLSEGCT